MSTTAFFPYRSAEARDEYLAYYDALAAKVWPVSSEERTVSTSYGPTFARVSGPADAPPLVLLPGAGATSLMWAPNIAALSTAFRTFAIDRMDEIGRSLCVKPLPHMSEILQWLDETFDALNFTDNVNLLGLSYGGAVAAQYALHYPKRLRKAVLLAPGATVLRTSIQFMVRIAYALLDKPRGFRSLMKWMFADMARKDPTWIETTLEGMLLCFRSLQRRRVPFPGVLTDAEWNSLAVPTLFLVGENETIYSAQKAVRRLRRVAPRVTAEIVPGAGHDLSFVQAGAVNRRVLEFLTR